MDCGPAKETPGIVRGMCEGKAACQLEAKHKSLQNPESRHCPGGLSCSYCLPVVLRLTNTVVTTL